MSDNMPAKYHVLAEIAEERARQDARWGEQNHPDHAPNQGRLGREKFQRSATHWKNRNRHRGNRGDLAFDGILLEEVYEACAETDPALIRAELIQVAATAVAWVEAIDRRREEPPAPDNLDNLDVETMCGDCFEGRCHWGGQRSRESEAAARRGEVYIDPAGYRCGCARHEISVRGRAGGAR